MEAQRSAAVQLYAEGRAETAREKLEALLPQTEGQPVARLSVLRTLLDVCLTNRNDGCVVRHAPAFVLAARAAAPSDDLQRRRLALETAYYFDQMRLRAGVSPADILAGASWKQEIAYDGALYLRRQVLAANLQLEAGDRAALDLALNKILSLAAALTNPQAAPGAVAASLSDVLATLMAIGETERAWGIYRAAGADLGKALPADTLDAAVYLLTVAQLHQQVGEADAARAVLPRAVEILRRIELEEAVREDLLAQALTLKAALHAQTGDLAAAQAALAQHPYQTRYAAGARRPASAEEVAYLAARAWVAAAAGGRDAAAGVALARPLQFVADPQTRATVEVYRAAGAALALPPGPERRTRLMQLGQQIQAAAQKADAAGELGRMGAVDRILIGLAVSQADAARSPAEVDAVFGLFQLAGRTGGSFDADALATLAQAKDELQRRTLHQALRLKARRDRVEREQIQKVAAALLKPSAPGVLRHDVEARRRLRDYDERMAAAERRLRAEGLSLRGPRLVRLADLQRVLRPDEAALAIAPASGGMSYLCVRGDAVAVQVAPVDAQRALLDARLVQMSLTAGHAPSEALDSQFPVAAAVRLNEVLVRPFESCLRAGDRIVWLGGVAELGAPFAALLPAPPPRRGEGYDLAAADWLVRRHALTYAGSAAAIVARRGGARANVTLDFLGVGDPVLDEDSPQGRDRRGALLQRVRGGSRFEGLAALPETRRELEASSRGFTTSRLLLGPAASEKALRSQMLGEYRYMSFATHGLLRDDLQGLPEPALVLTPRSGDPADDGLLTATEIADMNLRARFVALSACNTAHFDFDQIAQDLPAMASAFAVSGVPATLGTLWPVDSLTGELVVGGLFTRLHQEGVSPATALAEAQRAFLAAPPTRAHLHPRFWAPFVVMGDGSGDLTAARQGPVLKSVELLTSSGGEVLALNSSASGVAARFIAEPDRRGAAGEGVRLATAASEAWRQVDRQGAASRVLARLDATLVTGGYVGTSGGGRIAPQLQAYAGDGRRIGGWVGEDLSQIDAGIHAAAVVDRGLLFVVGERERGGATPRGVRLLVMRTAADLRPQKLFEIALPPGAAVSNATLTPVGGQVLLTYTIENLARAQPEGFDDYEAQVCAAGQMTVLELRELDGAVVRRQSAPGVTAVAAAAAGGAVLIGGSLREGCEGERQAVVLALDPQLAVRRLHLDDSLGASQVRALQPLQDGRIFVAAYKENLVDYRTGSTAADLRAGRSYSGMVLALDRNGRSSPVKLLDAGSDLLPTALATDDGDVLLGGSLNGQAAILRLGAP